MALQHRSKRRRMAEINIVPYIDVMLVLLIIFMVTAPMLNLGADIQLPQSAAKALQDEKQPVLVTVDQQGNVFLTLGKSAREQVDDEKLVSEVSAFVKQDPKVSVMLGGDKRVDYGRVNQVTGYADRFLKVPSDPYSPANRRIEILLEGKSVAGG